MASRRFPRHPSQATKRSGFKQPSGKVTRRQEKGNHNSRDFDSNKFAPKAGNSGKRVMKKTRDSQFDTNKFGR